MANSAFLKAFGTRTKGAWKEVRDKKPEARRNRVDAPDGNYVAQVSKTNMGVDKNQNPFVQFNLVLRKCLSSKDLPYDTARKGMTLESLDDVTEYVKGRLAIKGHFLTPAKAPTKEQPNPQSLKDKVRNLKDDIYNCCPEDEHERIAEAGDAEMAEIVDEIGNNNPFVLVGIVTSKDGRFQNYYINGVAGENDLDGIDVDEVVENPDDESEGGDEGEGTDESGEEAGEEGGNESGEDGEAPPDEEPPAEEEEVKEEKTKPKDKPKTGGSKPKFAANAKVKARIKAGGKLQPSKIVSQEKDGTYTVKCTLDGRTYKGVKTADIEAV